MLTRKGQDWTAKFGPIASALSGLSVRAAYLDGEIAVVRADSVSSFADLQEALSLGQAGRLSYYGFDLLHLDGHDLTKASLIQRKRALQAILATLPEQGPVHYSDHVIGNGIVSKLTEAPYRSGGLKARFSLLPPFPIQ
jgi:bifunctional non-homologous end joining protein LigD